MLMIFFQKFWREVVNLIESDDEGAADSPPAAPLNDHFWIW